jgi:hypothetical protein
MRSSFISYIPFYRTPPPVNEMSLNAAYLEQVLNEKHDLKLVADDSWIVPSGSKLDTMPYTESIASRFVLPFIIKYALAVPDGLVYDDKAYKMWYASQLLTNWGYQGRVYFDGFDAQVLDIKQPDEKLNFEYALASFYIRKMDTLIKYPSTNDMQFRLFINEWRAPDKRYKFVTGKRRNPVFWMHTRNLTSWDYGLLLDFWSACIIPLWARRQLRRMHMSDLNILSLSPDIVELVKNPKTLNNIRVLVWMMIKKNYIYYASALRWRGTRFDSFTLNEMRLMRDEIRRSHESSQHQGQEGEILQES